MMTDLRVACIGAGYFSQFHHDAWARIAGVEVVGAADLDPDALLAHAPGVRGFDDAARMLAEVAPDIVDIITPPPTHRNLLEAAMSSGARAVICQKPFCTGLAEAEEMAALSHSTGIPVIVHENFRWQPWYRQLKSMIDAGHAGDVMQITFRLRPGDGQGSRAYLDRQPYFQQMRRFLIHETGVHWIDTFRYLLGEPRTVWADLRQLNPVIAGEDAGLVVFGFQDGKRALFDGNRLSDHVAENRRRTMGECLVEGTEATLSVDGEGRIHRRTFGSNQWEEVVFEASDKGFGGDCVFALQNHVATVVREGGPFENLAADYLSVIRMEDAIYQSHETGQRVAL